MREKFLIISYDIKSDKRRRRLARVLEDYGKRIQFSVFECRLPENLAETLKSKIRGCVNKKADKVRIYPLTRQVLDNVIIIGSGEITTYPDIYITK